MISKELGILGLGSRSTLWYIEQLNARHQEIHGGFSTCPHVLLNTNFNQINPFLPDQFEQLEGVVKKYLDALVELGCSKILIPNMTELSVNSTLIMELFIL